MGRVSNFSGDLKGFANELRATLNDAIHLVETMPSAVAPVMAIEGSSPVNAAYVRMLIKMRRQRDEYFPDDLFADPAWDMLLELYAASLDQQRMSTTSLCDVAAVPSTTALRWIKILEAKGLALRRSDPLDARRVFIGLSATGQKAMEAYFCNWSRSIKCSETVNHAQAVR